MGQTNTDLRNYNDREILFNHYNAKIVKVLIWKSNMFVNGKKTKTVEYINGI